MSANGIKEPSTVITDMNKVEFKNKNGVSS